jgi:two-component system, cell cycle response regulator
MKKRILIVDDSKTQLQTLKILLTKSGHEVITAIDGVQGIQVALDTAPDLVVSDIVMPNINGYQLCRLLKNEEKTKHTPIILLTMLNRNLDRFWGLRAGADLFLTKEMGFENLVIEINNIIEKMPFWQEPDRRIQKNSITAVDVIDKAFYQEKINSILDASLMESIITNEFRNISEYISNDKLMIDSIILLLESILEYNAAGIFFNDVNEDKAKTLKLSISGVNFNEDIINLIKSASFDVFLNKNYAKDETFYSICNIEEIGNTFIKSMDEFKSKLIIPLTYEDNILGGICLFHKDSNKFDINSKIFNLVIKELKHLMRIKWLYSETKFLSIVDSLTKLYNRRFFEQTLDREFSRAKRYGNNLSLAIIDIDFFKNINDRYGHQFGDYVLQEISSMIKNFLRKTDYVARYGGEELAIIFPETALSSAIIPLDRIRNSIKERGFLYNEELVNVTVSVGVTNVNPDIKTNEILIKKADELLYKAKNLGRDRIEMDSYEQISR